MSGRNFICAIVDAGRRHPERLALSVPQADGRIERTRYGELLDEVARTQSALTRLGLTQGDRVLLAARPGRALYVLVIALLGLGLVPVLIDSGMTAARKRAALKASGARHVIGTRALLRFWWLLPTLWRLRRLAVDGAALGVGDL
ncbi:MAG: AMP-binding protein, partial [Moraxellaceae bacterium]